MPETGFFRGAGGAIFEMALPLPEVYEEQVTRGQLTRVNADGSGYEPPVGETPAGVRRPAASAPKNEWVGYAVSQGMSVDDADGMTKADLVEKLK